MNEAAWRTELASLFAARAEPTTRRDRLPALAGLSDALLPDASGYDVDLVDLLRFAVAHADDVSPDDIESQARRHAALAYLHAGITPSATDRERIAQGNIGTYNGDPLSKRARDTWAYMTYKRVHGDTRRAYYSYKPGLDRRSQFADALLAALEEAEQNPQAFAVVVRELRLAEQSAAALDYQDKIPGVASTEHRLDRSDARDVNLPDGSMVPLGARFTKTWEVRNIGQVPWIGRRLTRQTPQGPTFPSSADWIPIPDTFPGQSVRLSVDFVAARVQGFTEVRFKMTNEHGTLYFPGKYPQGLTLLIETAGVEWISRPTDLG